jgi:oxaloacetate decarboxylase alpha subunit
MTGTLKAQLAQYGMTDRLDEVLHETAVVRRELGYPVMATPFSQLVGIQAVLNVVNGKRYSVVPDEVIQYAAGVYGKPVAPLEPGVLDRIMSAPRARTILDSPPEQPTIEELRKRFGTTSDDELLLRALVPEPDLERMRQAGPVKRSYPDMSSPELDQVRRLMALARSPVVQIYSTALSVELYRNGI